MSQGIKKVKTLKDGTKQGLNSWGNIGYGGPMPPPGTPHRYFFKLYALDKALGLAPGASREMILSAMQGHVLSKAELIGIYSR